MSSIDDTTRGAGIRPQNPPDWGTPVGATDPRDLTLPLYGATFGQALSRFFRSYARFSGRASRSEYWWATLALGLTAILCAVLIAGLPSEPITMTIVVSAVVIVALGCALPGWALLVRRLHDADLSGWMSLLSVLPYAGAILQIVFGMLPPKPLGERFDRR
jgi:uncharacterized membrane protein YhaH (DUF805 family)